jgi:hypothetical protein
VVGLSNTGGVIETSSRSPAVKRSPSFTHRMRCIGSCMAAASRSTMNQVVTSVALGHRSSTSSTLPVWSWSSWER